MLKRSLRDAILAVVLSTCGHSKRASNWTILMNFEIASTDNKDCVK